MRRGATAGLIAIGLLAAAAGSSISLFQPETQQTRDRAQPARRGLVHLENRAYADDGGPFLAVGASLFWADWGYLSDRARTRAIICRLGQDGIDFIRVLAVVGGGSSGGDATWSDRVVGPQVTGWADSIGGLTDLAYRECGVRVQWTIFGGDSARTPEQRQAVVDTVIAQLRPRSDGVMLVELSNEGIGGFTNQAEAAALTRRVGAGLPNLTAVTTPDPGAFDAAPWYRGSEAPVLTIHLDRDTSGEGGAWRPVRQPERVTQIPGWGSLVRAWQNNEPIGPASSVRSDDDPVRLVMQAVNTWIGQGAAFVYHTGAGIRRGDASWEQRPERRAMGIPVSIWETSHYAETTAGFRAARTVLPSDLPNWSWWNSTVAGGAGHPFDVTRLEEASARGALLAAFGAVHADGRFIVAPVNVQQAVPFVARSDMRVELIDPMTARVIEGRQLKAGETWTLQPRSAYLIRGKK